MSKVDWQAYCSILYHLREEYYGTALAVCDEEFRKTSDMPQLILFRTIALVKLGTLHLVSPTSFMFL